jgi:hypothetical protein
MTGVVGSNFVTRDATTVPVTSPQSIASTTITLTVPQQAVQLQVSAPTAFNISEDSTVSEYLTVPANALYTFDVAKQQFVYINTTSTIVVSFAFKMLV